MTNNEAIKSNIIDFINNDSETLLKLCSDLIKIDSQNPPGDSQEISDYIKSYLAQYDLDVEIYESAPNMYNLISKMGNPNGKKLIYCGHSDVVPVGNLTKWDFDPFSGEVKDNYLLGRGASDMKAGLGGLIYAFTLIQRLQIQLDGEIILAIVPDEESGGDYGVPWLLERNLLQGDGALIAEPSSEYNPTIGQKGSYWFNLEVFGEPGHGSLSPIIGGNAITDTMKAIEVIKKLFEMDIQIPEEIKPLIASTQQYMRDVEKEKEPFQSVLERITFNIGVIEGGTKSNVVPESCKIEVDCRLPFGVKDQAVTDYLTSKWDELGLNYKMERFGIKSEANYSDPNEIICQVIINNLKNISQMDAYGVLQWASSDARHFRDYHIPVLQYGPAELTTIHGYNERVLIEKVILASKVYATSIIDFLNP